MMLRYLLEKEFKQFRRNKALPRMVLVMPLFSMLIFPLVANFEVRNLNLCVVDQDHSPYSNRLVNKVVSSGYFRLTSVAQSYNEALGSIERDQADIILEIPAGFERDLVKERSGTVMIAANAVNGTRGGLGSAYLNSIVNDFATELRSELLASSTRLVAPSLEIIAQYRYNPELEYKFFMIPAIMAMLLSMICGFLPALNIVKEKENGTIEQLNVTPIKRSQFILAKLIPYWMVGFVALTISILIAWLVYGLVPSGHIGAIYFFASIFILAISGLGLVISNFAKNMQQAMIMMFFSIVTMVLMGGVFTPIASMPDWAQTISAFLPLRYFGLAMRQIYLKGSDITSLMGPLVLLIGFTLLFNILAIVTYRKTT